ncbi:MAG: zinc metalloendopeptidase M23 protein [Deltaproteobacteria bacterium]|nr:zinc metalloendopeptidase M23 protein [Deltaproteobacteria bacterium]MBM2839295.1 zinc metalloendopeptidase protein [Deltaproteobacteria bacterium]
MAGRSKENDTNIKNRLKSRLRSRLKFFSTLASALAILSSCGTPYGIYHSVEKGQTLYSIAKAYNVPTQEIVRINRFKENVTIEVGDAVFIPGASREKMIEVTIEYKESLSPSASTVSKPQTASIAPRSKETAKTEKGRFLWPVNGKVISGFGMRNGEKHAGIDIKAEEGKPVKAADSGKVIYSGNGLNGYGNLIIIKHEGTFFTVYAHNKKNLASEGSLVEKGEEIAQVGDSGRATTPHLHFEIRKNKVTMDPILYLP